MSWSPNETPPIRSATLSFWPAPYLSNCSLTCAASSRVGSRMRVRGIRARARPFSSRVSIGSTNPHQEWGNPDASVHPGAELAQHRIAAIDGNGGAGYEVGSVRSEKHRDARKVRGYSPAGGRGAGKNPVVQPVDLLAGAPG